MSQFTLIETKSEKGKKYYVEGYVSTIDPDFVNDIVDEKGQKSTYDEINGKPITMDEDHDEWRDPETGKFYDGKKNRYPLALIVSTRLDSRGTFVRAMLNDDHPDFNRILNMIQKGFLHSFSIAYNVQKSFTKMIDGVKYRVIQALKIANIAITGNPINKGAKFNVALKSFSKKMVEENNTVETVETSVEAVSEEAPAVQAEAETEIKGTDYKKMYEELKAKYDKMVSEKENDKKVEAKSFEAEIKSVREEVEQLKAENAKLNEVLEKPQMKSILEAKSDEPKKEAPARVSVFAAM